MEHSCQVLLKSVKWFLTRRNLKFSIKIYRENKPRHLAAMFLTYHKGLNNLGRRSPKQHSFQVTLNAVQWFLSRRFLKFSI